MTSLIKRRATIILGLLLLVGGRFACTRLIASKQSPERVTGSAAPRPVNVMRAANGPVRIIIPITGRVRSTDRMLITAEVGGTLQRTARPFREGASFSRGEVLFRIDDGEVRAQINAQQSAFLRSLVQLVPDMRIDQPEAAPKWEAYLRSVPVDGALPAMPAIGSEQERNYLAGRGVLDQYYGIRALYERLGKYVITAPFDGVAVAAGIEPGTIVVPGTRLGEFIAPGALELETAIGAADLPFARVGDTLRLRSDDGAAFVGRITRLGESIDAATQTVKVFAQVKGERLRDGQYLTGSLEAAAVEAAIAVPRAALTDDGALYTAQDSALRKIPVQVLHQGAEAAVVRGVPDGRLVVIDRMLGGSEGLRVAPVER
jgi:hypothetical protein